jgi:hypothetical protein
MAPVRLNLGTTPERIELPLDWTSDQALAVFEVLGALREHLWACYGTEIQQALRLQQSSPETYMPTDIDDSDVPF